MFPNLHNDSRLIPLVRMAPCLILYSNSVADTEWFKRMGPGFELLNLLCESGLERVLLGQPHILPNRANGTFMVENSLASGYWRLEGQRVS